MQISENVHILQAPQSDKYNLVLPQKNQVGHLYNQGNGILDWRKNVSIVDEGTKYAPGIEFDKSLMHAGFYNLKTLKFYQQNNTNINLTNDMAYSQLLDIYVACGNTGTMYSYDTIHWNNTNNTHILSNVIWCEEYAYFICLIEDNLLTTAISTDGISYIDYATNIPGHFTSIAWSQKSMCFVAVSDTTQNIAYSKDGKKWSTIQIAGTFRYVIWSVDKNIFLAFGTGNNVSNFAYSPNGYSWSLVKNTAIDVYQSIVYSACYSSQLDAIIAVSNNRKSFITKDCLTWDLLKDETNQMYKIIWVDELNIFIALSNSNNIQIIQTSINGIHWTELFSRVSTYKFSTIFWSNINKILTVFSEDKNIFRFKATDNISTNSNITLSNSAQINGNLSAESISLSSCDIIENNMLGDFKQKISLPNQGFQNIAYSPKFDIFIGVGIAPIEKCMSSSSNGIDWQSVDQYSQSSYWTDITWSSNLGAFIAVGNSNAGGANILFIPDPQTYIATKISNNISCIAWSEILHIGVLCSNAPYYSYDGKTWQISKSIEFNAKQVLWGKDMFVAVGNKIMYSTDGINWKESNDYPTQLYVTIAYSDKLDIFVAASTTKLFVSSNINTFIPVIFIVESIIKVKWINELSCFICLTCSNNEYTLYISSSGTQWYAYNGFSSYSSHKCIGWGKNTLLLPTDNSARNIIYYNFLLKSLNLNTNLSAESLIVKSINLNDSIFSTKYKINGWIKSNDFGGTWKKIVYSNKKKIYLTIGPNIAYSYDLKVWYNTLYNYDIRDAMWIDSLSLFISISDHISTSPDGLTWTILGDINSNFTKIAWSTVDNILVAVGNLNINNVAYTYDLTNWTYLNVGPYNFTYVTWVSDASVFIALATSSDGGFILSSIDGKKWTVCFSDGNSVFSDFSYSQKLNMGIVINSSYNRYYVSGDLIHWTIFYAPDNPTPYLKNIIWSSELDIFLISSNQVKFPYLTFDGSSWGSMSDYNNISFADTLFMEYIEETHTIIRLCKTDKTFTLSANFSINVLPDVKEVGMLNSKKSYTTDSFTNIAYSYELNRLIAINNAQLLSGSSFEIWNAVNGITGIVNHCIWVNELNKFIACASDNNITNLFSYSYDGAVWATSNLIAANWIKLVYSNVLCSIICISNNTSGSSVAFTRDGINWISTPINGVLQDVIWHEDKFIAIGNNITNTSGIIATSIDGMSWELTQISILNGTTISASSTLNLIVINVFNTGYTYISYDLINWCQILTEPAKKILWVDAVGQFFSIGNNTKCSNDGYNWTLLNISNTVDVVWINESKQLIFLRDTIVDNIIVYETREVSILDNAIISSIKIGSNGAFINGVYMGQSDPIGAGGPSMNIDIIINDIKLNNPIVLANIYTSQITPDAFAVTVLSVNYSNSNTVITINVSKIDNSAWSNDFYRVNYVIYDI